MKNFEHIETDSYQAWFSVKTEHDFRLEFVLDDTEQRNNRRHGYYSEALWDMLGNEFSHSVKLHVAEYQVYGHVSFRVEADTPKNLERALLRCDRVVQRWINKYRVNSMKEQE